MASKVSPSPHIQGQTPISILKERDTWTDTINSVGQTIISVLNSRTFKILAITVTVIVCTLVLLSNPIGWLATALGISILAAKILLPFLLTVLPIVLILVSGAYDKCQGRDFNQTLSREIVTAWGLITKYFWNNNNEEDGLPIAKDYDELQPEGPFCVSDAAFRQFQQLSEKIASKLPRVTRKEIIPELQRTGLKITPKLREIVEKFDQPYNKNLGSNKKLAQTLINLAEIENKSKRFTTALDYLRKAVSIFREELDGVKPKYKSICTKYVQKLEAGLSEWDLENQKSLGASKPQRHVELDSDD